MEELNNFGERLKGMRASLGYSLGDVSSLTGVSKTMLSQIERGASIPTLATVWKIANGLKIRFETLLENSSKQYGLNSIRDMEPVKDKDGKVEIYCISPFNPLNGFEMFYGTFKPGGEITSSTHKNCISECFMVIKGEVELTIGSKKYVLGSGQFITFDATENHGYANRSSNDAVLIFIVTYR